MQRRITFILLVFCMIMTIFPGNVRAEVEPDVIAPELISRVLLADGTLTLTFSEAIDTAGLVITDPETKANLTYTVSDDKTVITCADAHEGTYSFSYRDLAGNESGFNDYIAVSIPHSHAVSVDCETDSGEQVAFTAWENDSAMPTKAGNYYLTCDVQLASCWNVPTGTVNLCLNGHKLESVGEEYGNSSVIQLYDSTQTNSVTLSICDCDGYEGVHTYTSPVDGTQKTVNGGLITGGKGNCGSAVYGGGIVNAYGILNLYGGTIAGNNTAYTGGMGSSGGVENGGIFNMYGGAITDNAAASYGGGVTVGSNAVFNMSGGSITGNLCKDGMHSGVHVDGYIGEGASRGTVNLSGAPVIAGNKAKDGMDSNLCLSFWSGSELHEIEANIVGAITEGAEIGIYTDTDDIGYHQITGMTDADYSPYFTSDRSEFAVLDGGEKAHYLYLSPVVSYAIAYDANGGTGSMENGKAIKNKAFTLPDCGFGAPNGKKFKCWAIGSADGTQINTGGTHTFAEDTTVYALWEDDTKPETPSKPETPAKPAVKDAPDGAELINGEFIDKNQPNTKLSKITAGKKSLVINLKKVKTVKGYEIQTATDKKFTKNKKTTTIKKNKTVKSTIKKLKAGKKYYVRVRTYKEVSFNGKTVKVYSKWSGAKSKKVK